jgi:DNA-binding XRE family transcriptional regulator
MFCRCGRRQFPGISPAAPQCADQCGREAGRIFCPNIFLFRAANCAIHRAFSLLECRSLPFYERVLHVVRKHVIPVWTRSFPISKEPKSLGENLRQKRFSAGLRQSEAAQILGVSNRTLSLWETDRVYPAWAFQPRLIAYLGYDPFTDPALGNPRGNEPPFVAFLSKNIPVTFGQKMMQNRLKLRKTRKQMALELGVSVKTLWGWETDR